MLNKSTINEVFLNIEYNEIFKKYDEIYDKLRLLINNFNILLLKIVKIRNEQKINHRITGLANIRRKIRRNLNKQWELIIIGNNLLNKGNSILDKI